MLPDSYLNYEGYIINGLDEDISDTGMRNAKGAIEADENNNKALVGRLGLGLNRNLEFGVSAYQGKFGAREPRREMVRMIFGYRCGCEF